MNIEGRILFYNTQTGHGKLILKSGEKSNFDVDVWDDFEAAPEAGVKVNCLIENGVIKSIKVIHLNTLNPSSNAQQTSSTMNNNMAGEGSLLSSDEGEATYSVRESLRRHFTPIDHLIGKPPKVINTEEQLDYFLARRFLRTAYNNLKGIDPSLYENKEVKDSSYLLEKLDKTYSSLTDEVDVPHIAFEVIFLKSQPEYIEFLEKKENSIERITMLSNIINTIAPEMEKKEYLFKNTTKANIKKELETKLKKLRGTYADSIHEKATLAEELDKIPNLKVIYTEKYFNSFKSELAMLKVEYKKILLKILNYKAYELDKLIWKHAGKSRFVQGFFKNSQIQGDYSTTTYLRYYLKSLDKEKLTDEQEELFTLLEYLETNHT